MQNGPCLRVIIVGAGLSGLATAISCAQSGHSVVVLDVVEKLEAVGAGIQITPNSSRILLGWSLSDSLWEKAALPASMTVRRYADGKILSREAEFGKIMRERYKAPFLNLHRADLQGALVERATDLGVEFRLGEKVEKIDFEKPEVLTASGTRFSGDLIVGADGLRSRCRECLLDRDDKPVATGDLAYRIILNLEDIPDEDLRAMVSKPSLNFWIGPDSHVVSYSLRSGNMYNIVLMRPDDLPVEVARQEGSVEELKKLFESWDPMLRRFLDLVTTVDKWKLFHRPEMESWINNQSNVVLIGDACHPMLPYLAQGANSAIEDGVVLGSVLSRISSKQQLPQALKLFEQLRKTRGEAIARESFGQRDDWHMPDGPAQQARDLTLAIQLEGKQITEKFPSRWSCPVVQPWLFGYDGEREVEKALAKHPFTSVPQEKL